MCQTRQKMALWTIVLILEMPFVGWAQYPRPDIEKQLESLKRDQEKAQNDIQQIKSMLQMMMQRLAPAQSAPAIKVRDVEFLLGDNNPIGGVTTARLAVIEFTDYQ
jgi:hypothetical protein